MNLKIRIAPLPDEYLQRVRSTGRDDLGQPVKRLIAEGGEPCRDVLRRARPGERLILASHSPFSVEGPYREFGPIFVLEDGQSSAFDRDSLPLASHDAEPYLQSRFVLRAYNSNEEIADAALVTPESAEEKLQTFFAREDVAFVHARFPTYGCFACRIERG